MKVTLLDHWFGTLRRLPSVARIAGHDVRISNDFVDEKTEPARRLHDTEAGVLVRE